MLFSAQPQNRRSIERGEPGTAGTLANQSALRSTRPPKLPYPLVEPERRRPLLFTCNMGKCFGMSIGPFLYDDVLISFLIDRLLAVSAKYDFGHFESSLNQRV
jgi:hypothetical protein